MPALFAYMVAVGLLLGGGYGVLNWLAAPEPIKLVAKTKPKPPPAYEASSEMASRAPDPAEAGSPDNAAATSDSDKAASTPNAQSTPATAESTARLDAQAKASGPAAAQHPRAAHAEVAVEQKPQASDGQQPARAVPPVMPANLSAASPAPSPAAAKVKRPHLRKAGQHPERAAGTRRLALMVLRTIEYPDGRRVSQLLPYRARRDTLAFGPDE
jgi:hypothetical protein